MATNKQSFWQLLESNKICIPIIQRDYAQGRKEESEKREKFLESIFKHLTNQNNLQLDFVYGRVKNNVFYPIDGQQRLTTLFLLHWYFAIKEDIKTDKKSKLTRFVYDTRISSREFCKSIVEEVINIPGNTGDNSFAEFIMKQYWFRSSWHTDPTIKAMLIMIQAIHDKFHAIKQSSVFEQLVEQSIITFEVLDLGSKDFELTDELYIKMNSRGKQLTTFENFKANFIQLIDKYYKNKNLKHPIKGEISYSGYFSYKIEREWTNLFWAFRAKETIVDSKFYAYFEFVAQMCYFKKYKDAKAEAFINSFQQYEDIFQNKENLLFLFNSLDKLHALSLINSSSDKQKLDSFFHIINFSSKLFWNNTGNSNLFERLITNVKNEDPRNKIVLFGILSYLIKFDTNETNDELYRLVRVIRNLMQANRQRNDTKYNTNIRMNYFGSYWLLIEQLLSGDIYLSLTNNSLANKGTQISDISLKNEIEKASILLNEDFSINEALIGLEELDFFGGLLQLLKPNELSEHYPEYLKCFKEIFNNGIPCSLIIRCFVACGFEGVYIKDCKMGGMRYFGENGNWATILTNDNKEKENIRNSIIEFFIRYNQYEGTAESKLDLIIKDWLEKNPLDRTWKHYFIKYPDFTSRLNYYAWPNDFELRLLGSEGSNPLVAYHISPFVLTICKKINDKRICEERDCYLQYSGQSPLILKNGITLTSTKDGWLIEDNQSILPEILLKKYLIVENYYILKEVDLRDRIELATDFINELFIL